MNIFGFGFDFMKLQFEVVNIIFFNGVLSVVGMGFVDNICFEDVVVNMFCVIVMLNGLVVECIFNKDQINLIYVDVKNGNDWIMVNIDILVYVFGGGGNDFIFGGFNDDFLYGGLGEDDVWGKCGDDMICFGIGNDVG